MASKMGPAAGFLRNSRILRLPHVRQSRVYSSKAEDFRTILRQIQEKEAAAERSQERGHGTRLEPKRATEGWRHMSKKDRDPYDKKVDTYGDKIIPEPYRNGLGGSVQGPQNPDRDLQVWPQAKAP